MPKYRIGCSGFLYDSWKGAFYPDNLPHKYWLTFYMQKFNTVELNVTFYRLLKKEAFERWYKDTPPEFSFSLKGSRFITHVKKLKDVELPLSTFFNATAPLMEKLEVVLWQLPPNLKLNMTNLEDFIDNIKVYPVRHVFEFRHKTWLSKKVLKLLAASNIAVCMADWPEFIDDLPVTADFVYLRRHGEGGSFATNYSPEQLKQDAKRIKEYLKMGKDVYFYFNNDAFAYAPKNAIELKAILDNMLPKSVLDQLDNKKKPGKKKVAKKKTVKKAASKAASKVAKKIAKKVAEKAKKKAAKKKAAKKSTKKAVKKTTKKSAKKTAKKPVKTKSAKKKAVKKAAKKTTKKKTKKK
ncbi:MAG: DUF72 domain-containing protein [Nitrospiraceae bacterium]|nr:MAG: DUF72 domain-containing protein [Nitrospiraceae bacterium]